MASKHLTVSKDIFQALVLFCQKHKLSQKAVTESALAQYIHAFESSKLSEAYKHR